MYIISKWSWGFPYFDGLRDCPWHYSIYRRIHINRGGWFLPISQSILKQLSLNLQIYKSIYMHGANTLKIS